jgi:hypothetical protein
LALLAQEISRAPRPIGPAGASGLSLNIYGLTGLVLERAAGKKQTPSAAEIRSEKHEPFRETDVLPGCVLQRGKARSLSSEVVREKTEDSHDVRVDAAVHGRL